MFSFEGCDLARESVSGGHGVCQSLRPCREVSRHRCEVGFRLLVLCGETYVLGREFGVCLRRAFLVVVPSCPGLVELVGEFLVSGSFSKKFFLEEFVGSILACVGMMGIPYFSGQGFVPSVGLLSFVNRLLGLRVHLK